MRAHRRTAYFRIAAPAAIVAGALIGSAALPLSSWASPSVGQLSSALSQQQTRQRDLAASVGALSQAIGALGPQIALVQSREAAVQTDLGQDQAALTRIQAQLAAERRLLGVLRGRLARARMLLARQLVSDYESDSPDLVNVVLEAHGFTDLLERLSFLHQAERQQQGVIKVTRALKAQADSAQAHLQSLQSTELQVTEATTVRARALAGMNSLLQSKQVALGRAKAAQQSALQASRAKGQQLQSEISQVQAEQAAAQRAAASAGPPTSAGTSTQPATSTRTGNAHGAPSAPASATVPTTTSAPSGGWAIPYPIVLCESGGQNLPPNGAGASGYYQIVPGTWKDFGGTGSAAYQASKAEQSAVASRIWSGGSGASNWVCAGIVGIH